MAQRLFIIMLFCGFQLSAQELPPRTLDIVGTAEQQLTADKVSFHFSVVGLGSSLRTAVDDAKSKTDKILQSLNKLGVPSTAIQTEEFTSGENWDKAFLSSSRDFQATVRTQVTLDSIALLEAAVLAVSDHKPGSISNVSFQLSEFEKIRRDIQLSAILDAKTQAGRIAKELGIEIKGPLNIVASTSETSPLPSYSQSLYVRGGRAGEVSYSVDGVDSRSIIGTKKILVKQAVRIIFQY